jgi:hypothetical protein
MLISQTVETYTAAQRAKHFSKTRVTLLRKIAIVKTLHKQCIRVRKLNWEYRGLSLQFEYDFNKHDKMLDDAHRAWRHDPTLEAEKEKALATFRAFINSPENIHRSKLDTQISRIMRSIRSPVTMLAPVVSRYGFTPYTPHHIDENSDYLATVIKMLPVYQRELEAKAKRHTAAYARKNPAVEFHKSAYRTKHTHKDRTTCPICLAAGPNWLFCNTQCGHVFHRTCVNKWMEGNSTCPICRRRIHVVM